MPYIEEKQDSRTMNWNSKSATTSRTYNMFDYPDTQDAILALGAYVPTDVPVATYLCVQPEYEVTPIFSDPDRTLYEGKVTWKTPDISAGGGGGTNDAKDPKEPEDPTSLTISFTSMPRLLQNSITSEKYSDADYTFSYFSHSHVGVQPINQQNDMLPPEGIEINSPIVIITAKTVIPSTKCTPTWQKERFEQLWTTNAYEWNGLPAEHVMFTGMELSQRSDNHWDCTYTFEYRPQYFSDGIFGYQKFAYYNDQKKALDEVYLHLGSPFRVVDARYTQVKKTIDDGSGYEKTIRTLDDLLVHTVYYATDFEKLDMVGIPISSPSTT